MYLLLLGGATIGFGCTLLLAGLAPTATWLQGSVKDAGKARFGGQLQLWQGALSSTSLWQRVRPSSADMVLCGVSASEWWTTTWRFVLGGAGVGLAIALWLTAFGSQLSVGVWLLLAIVAALGGFLVATWRHRQAVAAARRDFEYSVLAYLELVSLARRGGFGTVQALTAAANELQSPGFALIRTALQRAQVANQPAWTGLKALGLQVGNPALVDLAELSALSGQEGAATYPNLRNRTVNLRTELILREEQLANSASERMVVPVACLALILMAILAVPSLVQLTNV